MRYILILFLLWQLDSELYSQGSVLTFFDGQRLCLRWSNARDADADGYQVWRQEQGSTEWTLLTPHVLSMPLQRSAIERVLGFRTPYFLAFFGVRDSTSGLNQDRLRTVFADNTSANFLDAACLLDPEFSRVMGLIYFDNNIILNREYRYRIDILKDGSASTWVTTSWLQTTSAESVPAVTGLEGAGLDGKSLLQWEKRQNLLRSGSVVTYHVYRSNKLLGPYTRLNVLGMLPVLTPAQPGSQKPPVEEYVDDYLDNGSTWYYYVRAVNAFGIEGQQSITLEITVGADLRPQPPSGIRASLNGKSVRLDWNAPSGPVDGFRIWRAAERKGEYQRVYPTTDLVRSERTWWLDTRVTEGGSYFYLLQSLQGKLTSLPSDTLRVDIPDLTPPSPPAGLKATNVEGGILLNWESVKDDAIRGYYIYRTSDQVFKRPFQLNSILTSDTSWIDSIPAESQTTYGYTVIAVDLAYNESSPTDMVKVRMPDIVPPQSPFLIGLEREGDEVVLRWSKVPDPDLLEYRIYQSEDQGEPQLLTTTREVVYRLRPGGKDALLELSVSSADKDGNESLRAQSLSIRWEARVYPEPPLAFTASRNKDHQVELSWQSSSSGGVIAYALSRADDSGRVADLAELPADATSYTDGRVKRGEKYTYTLRAVDKQWRLSRPATVSISVK